MGVEPVIDISKVNEEREIEKGGRVATGGGGAVGRGPGGGEWGDRVIEVARTREARLARGKRERGRDG